MPDQSPEPLRSVIGARLAEIRTAEGVRQQDVSDACRAFGLNWDRSTVAAVERGAKPIPIEALVVLPYALAMALRRIVAITELFDTDTPVTLTPAVSAPARTVGTTLAGIWASGELDMSPDLQKAIDPDGTGHKIVDALIARAVARADQAVTGRGEAEASRVRDRAADLGLWPVGKAAEEFRQFNNLTVATWMRMAGDAEGLVAQRIGEPPGIVVAIAHVLWGRTLRDQRDQELESRGLPADTPAAALRAARGQITRILQAQIEVEIKRRLPLTARRDLLFELQRDAAERGDVGAAEALGREADALFADLSAALPIEIDLGGLAGNVREEET